MESNPHKDHRSRVRAAYLKSGTEPMADHNVLELLLFYGIPYKDTNKIAHALIEKFGDLNGVLDAPVEELMKTDGIGENTAVLIKLTRDVARRYAVSKNNTSDITVGEKLDALLCSLFSGEGKECTYLIPITSERKVIRTLKLSAGSPDTVNIDNRTLIEAALRQNCTCIILAHSHPNGFAVPSQADVEATANISGLLSQIGIRLSDHIIVSGNDCFSMAKSKKYADIFK